MDFGRWLDEHMPLARIHGHGSPPHDNIVLPIIIFIVVGLAYLATREGRFTRIKFWKSEQTPAAIAMLIVAELGLFNNWQSNHAIMTALWGTAILVFGLLTISTAEQRASRTDSQMGTIQGDVTDIKEDVGRLVRSQSRTDEAVKELALRELPNPTEATERRSQQSDREVAEDALIWVKRMRDFEAEYERKKGAATAAFFGMARHISDAERQIKWNEMTQRTLELSREESVEFSNRLLGRANQLREEMLRRVPNPGDFDDREFLAFRGMLAGPYPIAAAANYLERLARAVYPAVQ
jgi:hypothetical protein